MTTTIPPTHDRLGNLWAVANEPPLLTQEADAWDRPLLHGLLLVALVVLFQVQGVEGWVRTGEACLPTFSASTEAGDSGTSVSHNVALTHAIRHLTGTDRGRPAVRLWASDTPMTRHN